MTEHARTLRALRGFSRYVIRRAVTESRAGYEFSANSHAASSNERLASLARTCLGWPTRGARRQISDTTT